MTICVVHAFERRRLADGMRALVSRPLAEVGVVAAFFERTGGVSRPPFASLNGSFRSGDDRDAVAAVIASDAEPSLALVHVGWRGLAAGIIPATVSVFAEPSGLRVALGPTIGPCHYEVGEEVIGAVDPATPGGAVIRREAHRVFLDLAGSVRRVLEATGVEAVHDAGTCTACHPDRFFSHRAERRTGRHLTLAVRTSRSRV